MRRYDDPAARDQIGTAQQRGGATPGRCSDQVRQWRAVLAHALATGSWRRSEDVRRPTERRTAVLPAAANR